MPRFVIVFVFLVSLASATAFGANGKPKYVFLFVGDGMGPAQIQLTELFANTVKRETKVQLAFHDFPIRGRSFTHSFDSPTTDSAASATAFASGFKTYNGVVGRNPKGQNLVSIATLAKQAGLKVGILTSTSIDHATPAAFYAHQPNRGLYYDCLLYTSPSPRDS